MNQSAHNERFAAALRAALADPPAAEGPHVAEDEETLLRWVEGDLSSREHERIIDHMADCGPCRREIAAMIEAGALVLPEVEADAAEPDAAEPDAATAPFTPRASRLRNLGWIALAAAASLLVAAVLWSVPGRGPESMLARAERELKAGQAAQAMDRVEKLLGEELDPDARRRAKALLEASGYQIAREELAREDFETVVDVQHRVASRAGPSPRLLNLRLQAERGVPAEHGLAAAGALTDYGYEPDGASVSKSLPTFDGTGERLDRQFRAALAEHPKDVALRLNYGHFLLGERRFDEAREQLEAALALDGQNPLGHLGLGLAAYELSEYQAALERFETVIRLDPENPAGYVNAAMALQELGRDAEAVATWQKAARLAEDPGLSGRIERHLDTLPENPLAPP